MIGVKKGDLVLCSRYPRFKFEIIDEPDERHYKLKELQGGKVIEIYRDHVYVTPELRAENKERKRLSEVAKQQRSEKMLRMKMRKK